LTTPGKVPHFASPGKNPSDAHIAETSTIMRFVGSNNQVHYDNLHQRWANIFYGRPPLKTLLLLGGAYITFVRFSYTLLSKYCILMIMLL